MPLPRFPWLLPVALLVACAPRAALPQTQIQPTVQVEGKLLTVQLWNTGPYDLLLRNDCPRPFALQVQEVGGSAGALPLTPLNTCVAVTVPPVVWRVGEKLSASVEVPASLGSRSLRAEALVQVRLASDPASAPFKPVQVKIPAFQVNFK